MAHPALVIVVPVTTVNRGWLNHILLRGNNVGLNQDSYAVTEQPRTIDRTRILSTAGIVDAATMH